MSTAPSPETRAEQPVISDFHVPDGPPSSAPLDVALAQSRDAQAAAAEHAAGTHSAETLLSIGRQLPYADQIDSETRAHQADSLAERDAADNLGSELVHAIKRGQLPRAVSDAEDELARELSRKPLPGVTSAHSRNGARELAMRNELATYESYLSGKATDGSGMQLEATVPSVSHRRYLILKWLKKLAFVPFDLGILYFTLRLVTRTEPGAFQLAQEIIETVCLVGLSALILLVLPNLMADAIARLRRHPSAPTRSMRGHWMVVGLLGVIDLGLVLLLAWLRAAYLFGGVSTSSELPLPFEFFFLIAVLWLLAPGVFVCLIVLGNHYENTYIPKVLLLREKLEQLAPRLDAEATEIELRNDSILLQEERRRLALDEHDVMRSTTLPRIAGQRKDAYFAELVRLAGDPFFTEAVVAHRGIVTTDERTAFPDPLAELIVRRRAADAGRVSLGIDMSRATDPGPQVAAGKPVAGPPARSSRYEDESELV